MTFLHTVACCLSLTTSMTLLVGLVSLHDPAMLLAGIILMFLAFMYTLTAALLGFRRV